ncbi:MAG: formyl-CoA transferase [Sphingomonadales bacterium]|nr:formyl-CoA transferase [Sphingomonadales bacterium]
MAGDLPLAGIRVLDLTQIYNGPYATFLMAMAGAEVIKIEPPGGEYLRRRDARSGADVPFAMLNGCKKSISLNLKTEQGKKLFLDLVADADIVAENFAPGVMARLGISYETLKAAKPGIILASGSGYGQDGDYRDFPAMDLTVQAMSGVMSVTGFPGNEPVKSGAALCDFFGGVHLYGAIMTALFRLQRTGKGSWIDVSMLESVYPSLASNIGMTYGERDDIPLRTGNRHGGLSLCPYNVYPTRDGFIAIICNAERHWVGLCDAMGRPDLASDDRFKAMTARVANMETIDAIVGDWTKAQDKGPLFDLLIQHRVPCAPVRDLPEVIADRAMHKRGALLDIDHPVYGKLTVCRSPLRFSDVDQAEYVPFPSYGEHNSAIYGELGLTEADLADLSDAGVI